MSPAASHNQSAATVIIPARLGSTRFPEKVLADRTGRPLVQHVVDSVKAAAGAKLVCVATDSERVAAALAPFGTRVVMTSPDHPNGTSRLNEAAAVLGLVDDAVIVNAQGDEPEMQAAIIDAALAALQDTPGASMGTVAARFGPDEDPRDPNFVKVVRARDGRALMFSRSLIPFDRSGLGLDGARPLRHLGVYAYTRGFLAAYCAAEATPLEQTEQLEQLRALEMGFAIGVHEVANAPQGIDTPAQYEAFVQRWKREHP